MLDVSAFCPIDFIADGSIVQWTWPMLIDLD